MNYKANKSSKDKTTRQDKIGKAGTKKTKDADEKSNINKPKDIDETTDKNKQKEIDEKSDTNESVNEEMVRELIRGSFSMEKGMKTLIKSHIKLNRKVGIFNIDLAALAKGAESIDKAILDIENRIRKLEGRTDFSQKSFLEDILRSSNISEDLKLLSSKILSMNAELQGLRKDGKDISLEYEKFQSLLARLDKSGTLLDQLGFFEQLETESMTPSQIRKLKHLKYQEGYEGRSSDISSDITEGSIEDRRRMVPTLSYQGIQRWDEEYAESLAGVKVKRIPGVSYDTYERSLNPFLCRKCGEKIKNSERLITALMHVDINYFLKENPTDEDVNLFICRICGLPVTNEQFIREHISSHIDNNHVCYCLKCQRENNEMEDSYDNMDEDSPGLISLRAILTLDDRAFTTTRHDITFAPRCANCGRVFSYLIPLVRKIAVHNPDSTSSSETEKFSYVCLVCGMKKSYKSNIELHALGHIENNELYCNMCSEVTSETDRAQKQTALALLAATKKENK